jgi:hypothetical protein
LLFQRERKRPTADLAMYNNTNSNNYCENHYYPTEASYPAYSGAENYPAYSAPVQAAPNHYASYVTHQNEAHMYSQHQHQQQPPPSLPTHQYYQHQHQQQQSNNFSNCDMQLQQQQQQQQQVIEIPATNCLIFEIDYKNGVCAQTDNVYNYQTNQTAHSYSQAVPRPSQPRYSLTQPTYSQTQPISYNQNVQSYNNPYCTQPLSEYSQYSKGNVEYSQYNQIGQVQDQIGNNQQQQQQQQQQLQQQQQQQLYNQSIYETANNHTLSNAGYLKLFNIHR